MRRPHRLDTDGFDGVLAVRWGSDRTSFVERDCSYPNLPTKLVIPTSSVSFIFFSHTTCAWSLRPSNSFYLMCLLQVGDKSRSSSGVSMDGQSSRILNPGESVRVHASRYPIPCINRSSISDDMRNRESEGVGPGKEDDWVRDINNLLQYNATFRSKALLRHSRV